jgi:hypothetical protein
MQIKKHNKKIEQCGRFLSSPVVVISLCLVACTAFFLYATYGSLIWTSDSFQYWGASRSFRQNFSLDTNIGDGAYVYWPPLFPVILSLFKTELAYHIAQGILLNTSVLLCFLWLKQLTPSKKSASFIILLYTLSVFPYLMSSFLWSEVIFTLFLYLGLWLFAKWEKEQRGWLLLLAMLSFLFMCLQRNAGIFIMIGLSVYCALRYYKSISLLFFLGGLILVAVLPNVLWNVYHQLYANEAYEAVEMAYFSNFFSHLALMGQRLCSFFIPSQLPTNYTVISWSFLLALLIISFTQKTRLPAILLWTYIFLLASMPYLEQESDRFLAPLIPAFLFILYNGIKPLYLRSSKVIRVGVWIIVFCLMSYNVLRTYHNTSQWHERSIHHAKDAKIFF